MTKTNLIFLFLVIASNVFAASDSYIFIDSKNMGLCLSVDSLEPQKCQNETLMIDGTSDHTLYIMPQGEIKSSDDFGKKASYALLTPANILTGGVGLLLFFIIFAYLIMALASNLRQWKKR